MEYSENAGRIARIARRLALLARLLGLLLVPALAVQWALGANGGGLNLPVPVMEALHGQALTPLQRLGGFIALAPSALALAVALFALARICGEYARGALFSGAVLQGYRRLGWSLAATTVLHWLQPTLVALAVTLGLPPGQRLLVVGVSSDDLVLGLVTAVVFLLGAVMGVARDLQEDNAAIV